MTTQTADPARFVHLHLHSEYSLLDGGNRVDRLVDYVKELGMDAVAVTDHGNLFGAQTFYNTARAKGVKPILGCEAYVAPRSRHDKVKTGVADGGYHLVLLAETVEGWHNLMTLASEAYLTGFYYKPRIDRELLEKHSAGLIAINGHLGSELAYALVEYDRSHKEEHFERAKEIARWHADVFKDVGTGPRFYIELQHHIQEQIAINPHLIRLAKELGLPIVGDNDSHFLKAEEWDAHDTLICVSTGKVKADDARMKYPRDLYVKSAAEMREVFETNYTDAWNGVEGATTVGAELCDNTVRIAARCNVELEHGNHAPVVQPVVPDVPMPYNNEPDRTKWFTDFCADFRVDPYNPDEASLSQEELKARCDAMLRTLCQAGLIWRYGSDVLDESIESELNAAIRARLDRELGILCDKDISAYFLIVWDFVNWARQRGIPALARGSGVGTMVGYVLGLSNACPVEYGLLFERFTDPDRSEYPDIDIDLCQNGRPEVINYVREKYGHVAQIITFGTLGAKAVLRDVGRVFDLPVPAVDKIAKLVPDQLKITIDKALEQEPQLKALYDDDAQTIADVLGDMAPERGTLRRMIDHGRVLEGQARHAGIHAAGVIVATRPLHEIVPLYRPPSAEENEVVTQWDGPTCEDVGLLKMDFLGLRTISIIERAKKLIRETLPSDAIWESLYADNRDAMPDTQTRTQIDPLDLERIGYQDERVYKLFQRGDTTGVFQFESGGMRRLLLEMKPDRLADLIAANALYRPGPMDLIPDYNARKHGQQEVPKVHPIVDKFTKDTYGIMVYQEQVMQIVHELGGIPLRQAYTLIKAISKKKEKVINANRASFIDGAGEKGLAKKDAEDLFDLILKFAGYGFNKSHSTGYAIVAYHTALLKTYFPAQFMAAFLTFESQALKVEDWIKYKDECRRTIRPSGDIGIDVRPPDINLSDADFTVVFDDDEQPTADRGHIRFGLRALKGAGSKAIESIVHERAEHGGYRSIFDFCERVPTRTVNKATIEALVCCGSFDSVHSTAARSAMVHAIPDAVSAGQALAKDREAGQSALFGGGGFGADETAPAAVVDVPEPSLPNIPAWTEQDQLLKEKETLGFYVSAHPLDQHARVISHFSTCPVGAVKERAQDAPVVLGCLIKQVRPVVTRKGDRMAIMTIEDTADTLDAVLFPRTYAEQANQLTTDQVVFLAGTIDHQRGDPQLIVEQVIPIERAPSVLASALDITISERTHNGSSVAVLEQLAGLLRSPTGAAAPGDVSVPVSLTIELLSGRCAKVESRTVRVCPTQDLIARVTHIAGEGTVRITPGMPESLRKKRNRYTKR